MKAVSIQTNPTISYSKPNDRDIVLPLTVTQGGMEKNERESRGAVCDG